MKKVILLATLLCIAYLQAADKQEVVALDELVSVQEVDSQGKREKEEVSGQTINEGGYINGMFNYFMPKAAVTKFFGEVAAEATREATASADQFTKEQIALGDQVLKNRITQADQVLEGRIDQADEALENCIAQLGAETHGVVDHMGEQADKLVKNTLQEGGPVDSAAKRLLSDADQQVNATLQGILQEGGTLDVEGKRFLGQASAELEETTQRIVDQKLRPLGHDLAIDLAQNLAKSALISIQGCFGAVLAYKGLVTYIADKQDNPERTTKLFGGYEVRTSTLQLCAATAGAGTFTAACLLTYYWFQKSAGLKIN